MQDKAEAASTRSAGLFAWMLPIKCWAVSHVLTVPSARLRQSERAILELALGNLAVDIQPDCLVTI